MIADSSFLVPGFKPFFLHSRTLGIESTRLAGNIHVLYCVAILAVSLFLAMLFSFRVQKRLHSQTDLIGEVRLILPVDAEAMRQLFDPSVEWNLRVRIHPETFRLIQSNRRRLAIQYASHMFHNAHILQKVGYAGALSHKPDQVIKGMMLVDAGVPVRLRSVVLLAFLRFQQLTYTGSNLGCLRDLVSDLLPDWEELVYAASGVSRMIHPRLHSEVLRMLVPPSSHIS